MVGHGAPPANQHAKAVTVSFPTCPAFKKRQRRGAQDLSGKRFGRLRVLTYAGYKAKVNPNSKSTGSILWLCQCDCGERKVARTSQLRHNCVVSCGCRIQQVTHGYSNTPTRNSYTSMMQRCFRTGNKDYPNYGARGITVCKRWQGPKGFANFLKDMGDRPRGKTMDRRDVNGNYAPGNCRWATDHMQRMNKRNSKANKPAASPQADVATFTGVEEPF
jgi:hypothetical protein